MEEELSMDPDQELTNYGRITVVGGGVTGQSVAKTLIRENKEVFINLFFL